MSLSRRILGGTWWLGLIVAGWGVLMFSSATPRGFDRYGVWQLERTEAARAWLSGELGADVDAMGTMLLSEPRQGPGNGLMPALLWKLSPHLDVTEVVRLTNILLVCLAAWCLFSIGQRAGGALAGLGAAVTLISVPRVWTAATSPGFTAPALFALTFGAMAMSRAREQLRWLIPALVGLVFALLTTQLAILLVLPWVYLTFFDTGPSEAPGLLRSKPLSPWGLLVFPAAMVLTALVFPPFRELGGVWEYLKAFVSQPVEPTLYYGRIYGVHRLPWHAAFSLTALTVPPTVLFLTVFGLVAASPLTTLVRRRLSGDAHSAPAGAAEEALRLSWAMLLLTWFMPLLLGTTHSHGVDLLALSLPWCAVFAGVGLKRLLGVVAVQLQRIFAGQAWARLGTLMILTVLGWGVFVFAFKDTEDVYPELESYYNWLVSGVDGAAELGLPRNPHGPIPPHFLSQLVDSEVRMGIAVVPEQPGEQEVLERYRRHGLIPEGLQPAALQSAELVVFRFDELSPEYYRRLPDLYGTVRSLDPSRVRWLRSEGLPLFGALYVGR